MTGYYMYLLLLYTSGYFDLAVPLKLYYKQNGNYAAFHLIEKFDFSPSLIEIEFRVITGCIFFIPCVQKICVFENCNNN